jgi:hypothetical protein
MKAAQTEIPQDVLDMLMVDTNPNDEEHRVLRRVIESYEKKRGTEAEPTYRQRLAQLCLSTMSERWYSEETIRDGIERCAAGGPHCEE